MWSSVTHSNNLVCVPGLIFWVPNFFPENSGNFLSLAFKTCHFPSRLIPAHLRLPLPVPSQSQKWNGISQIWITLINSRLFREFSAGQEISCWVLLSNIKPRLEAFKLINTCPVTCYSLFIWEPSLRIHRNR